MELNVIRVEVVGEATDAQALCRAAGVPWAWWQAAAQAGLVPAADTDEPLDAAALQRVRRWAWLQRHFDADPELAALVVQLEAEIERLRARLRRAGAALDI
ncbi:chaperone modulatory protein CbpM [Tepidimonas ignava]|uniref:Chaperone modulatory protein CbpM n=1 Tax=Tepidimonas ignava TaxID=114249 RepID=A0A4R3LF28_9BURK|nr:MerR family transcriptional regulator [Tepidimonas ignava]TCS98070.1 chaperone modulatory protein CbpM [Tepidimonas ignava]TSE22577.1 hypothetical protein Tigna_01013 [Tepidimonas ignava]